ncbi:hypothetical protein FACS1894152_6760 [Bacilli bacterium]|nr:hypothetical protein FACS1894152_6760 [Bacilli bacterium]
MSKYDSLKNLPNEDFERLVGVRMDIFNLMVKCLHKDLGKKENG